MQTVLRAPGASPVSSAAAGGLVTVSDFAGVLSLSGDTPCHIRDRSDVSAHIEAMHVYVRVQTCTAHRVCLWECLSA